MPDLRRKNCQRCGKTSAQAGPISWRGNCRPCGHAAADAMYFDLRAHAGPGFEYWRYRTAAAVGFAPLDDAPQRP